MTREEAIRHLDTYSSTLGSGQTTQDQHEEAKRMAMEALEGKCDEVNQIRWERDTAIQQLADLGYGLGEKPRRDDCISRQAAIDAVERKAYRHTYIDQIVDIIKALPSAQPEIIRCKDCKYRDENWRRVSVRWLPCMDMRTGSNWYCGSAERGEQE